MARRNKKRSAECKHLEKGDLRLFCEKHNGFCPFREIDNGFTPPSSLPECADYETDTK